MTAAEARSWLGQPDLVGVARNIAEHEAQAGLSVMASVLQLVDVRAVMLAPGTCGFMGMYSSPN